MFWLFRGNNSILHHGVPPFADAEIVQNRFRHRKERVSRKPRRMTPSFQIAQVDDRLQGDFNAEDDDRTDERKLCQLIASMGNKSLARIVTFNLRDPK